MHRAGENGPRFGGGRRISGAVLGIPLGMLVFTLGSWLCGTSESVGTLIMMRGVQAVGAAGIMSIGPAIVTERMLPLST